MTFRAFGRRAGLLARAAAQLRLLRQDPEQLGRNLLQYTNPEKFEARLVDILAQPPLQVRLRDGAPPALNVLQPVLDAAAMTGGPNTILLLAALVAEAGLTVRLVTTRPGHRTDPGWFAGHMASLLGHPAPAGLQVCAAADAAAPAACGADDLWLATHWTTAQALRPLLARMRRKFFLYLVQDYEPGFYAWSSNHALALETYDLPHRAIINEHFLAAHLRNQAPGRYADPGFLDQSCIVFEPAVDRRVFHPPAAARATGPSRLLFYARPTNPRNLFGLGLQALRAAVASGAFPGAWEFCAIAGRGSLDTLSLGGGHALRPVPWESYAGYADTLRGADLLLCPMLSPHTSYPVLEMAACGGAVVTTAFREKTAERLRALSPDIIGAPATLDGLVDALRTAAGKIPPRRAGARQDRLALEANWHRVLAPVAAWAAAQVRDTAAGG
jgi:hypothetical protein